MHTNTKKRSRLIAPPPPPPNTHSHQKIQRQPKQPKQTPPPSPPTTTTTHTKSTMSTRWIHDWHYKAFNSAINHRKDINIWWVECSRTSSGATLSVMSLVQKVKCLSGSLFGWEVNQGVMDLLIGTMLRLPLCKKATIHHLTAKLAASKNVLLPGCNHLLTTGTDDFEDKNL